MVGHFFLITAQRQNKFFFPSKQKSAGLLTFLFSILACCEAIEAFEIFFQNTHCYYIFQCVSVYLHLRLAFSSPRVSFSLLLLV